MSNTKQKSIKNILYGIMGQLITIVFGLVVPRLILLNYGSETNGLISSITQIFVYISLLEAGVGGATLQALYKPVGKGDKAEISAILAATNQFYRRTGVIYAFMILLLAIFYPMLVNTELSYWTVFGVIMFNGMGGVINYFFQGKYHLLLQAEGKNYIKVNLTTAVYVVSNILKIVLVLCGFGIVTLQAVYFALNIFQMLYVVVYIKRHYKWLDLSLTPNFEAISQKNSVMVHNICALIFGNTDSIILTFFCGLKVVSVYSLIASLIAHANNLLSSVSNGILFSLGQNFQNNRKKFDLQYSTFETVYYMMMTFCLAMIYIFLNPFLEIYTRGVTDIGYVDEYLPYLFMTSYWLTWARVPSIFVVNNCAGHFKLTQNQAVLESVINIVVSLVCVSCWGIYGVLMGTISALLYRTNEMIIYSAKKILNRSVWVTYRKLIFNLVWLIVVCVIGKVLLPDIDGYFWLILWAIIYAIAISVLIVFLNYIFNKKDVTSVIDLLRK